MQKPDSPSGKEAEKLDDPARRLQVIMNGGDPGADFAWCNLRDTLLYAVNRIPEIVNVNGGAIAFGHPLGCTDAKLTATLLAEMRKRQTRCGMVTMCIGGGMGAAGIFEQL